MNRNLGDIWNLLSKSSPRRAWNAAKVLSSYYLTRISRKPVQWGLPISLSIEPTTSCNLRCPQCPSGLRQFTRNTGMLQKPLLEKLIDELHPTLSYITFYFQGEPYLNRQFLDYVNYASRKKIYTASSTNGHYLDDETARKTVESGLDRLLISLDGIDQESYAKYRVGGKLEKVLEGTANLLKWKKEMKSKTPYVIWQFIVFSHNENQVEEVKALGKKYGVDEVAIKTAQVYDFEHGNDLIPKSEKYSRYTQAAAGFRIKNKLFNHCWRLWHSPVITWDGEVSPCCFDKDASHRLGNISTSSFLEIWKNSKYQLFRKKILRSRKEIDICSNCTEGTKVWI